MNIRKLTLVIFFIFTAVSAHANKIDEALDAMNADDFTTALSIFRPLAKQGDAQAQFWLGAMYFYGKGLPQDIQEAKTWIEKAAQRGYAKAQNFLGKIYRDGIAGTPINNQESVKWFRLAAEQDYAVAQISLGEAYLYGRGVQQNKVNAATWFEKAAEQGNHTGQYLLGVLFTAGLGNDYHICMLFALAVEDGADAETVKEIDLMKQAVADQEQCRAGEAAAAKWKPGIPLFKTQDN